MAEDKKNTRTKLSLPNQVSSDPIQAYLDAKAAQSGIRTNWDVVSDISSDVLGGIQTHREEVEIEEKRRKEELEGYENEFSNNINRITENAGSLGEEYYSMATEEAKKLQEEYMQAVQTGDKEMQSKLKMKLNGLSTSVQSLKESLTIAAESKNNGTLSNGRTAEEVEIATVCTNPANIVYADGEWKWKNPKYDPSIEDKKDYRSKEFFTQEDLSNSLGEIDEVTSKAYLDYEKSMNTQGYKFVEGETKADFDRARVKTSIADTFITQDNIMSMMHDDLRKSGDSHTFRRDLEGYLDDLGDNNKMWKTFGIDIDGDGVVDPEDKKAIVDKITNKNSKYGYDYEVSKNILAEYLTMHVRDKFYGESKPDLVPEHEETIDQFKKRGGIVGKYFDNPQAGVVYKDPPGIFIRTIEEDEAVKVFK